MLLMLLVLLSGTILVGQLKTPSASPATTASVNPSEIADKTMGPGSTFNISVSVTEVEDLWGYQVVLSYNTTVLNATGFQSYAPFTDESPSSINRTAGYVSVVYSMAMGTPVGGGVTTNASVPSVNLVRIDFTVIEYGASTLDLSTVKLADPAAAPIVAAKINGSFSNIEIHNIVITGVKASQTRVEAPGGVFSFNVNLSNRGDFPETFNLSATIRVETGPLLLSFNQTDVFLATGDNMTQSLDWDTTGSAIGEYIVTFQAILPIDSYPSDNSFVTKVRIGMKRDVSVTNVTVSTLQPAAGEPVIVYVTVKNLGNFSESFQVVSKYRHDSTETVIGTQQVNSLIASFSSSIAFNWETEGLPSGDFTIVGEAVTTMDDDLSNNILVGDTLSFGGTVGTNIFIYAVIAIIVIVVAVVVVRYALRRRKPKK
jgi:hypothetical protein